MAARSDGEYTTPAEMAREINISRAAMYAWLAQPFLGPWTVDRVKFVPSGRLHDLLTRSVPP
jgi:hypothetical protein